MSIYSGCNKGHVTSLRVTSMPFGMQVVMDHRIAKPQRTASEPRWFSVNGGHLGFLGRKFIFALQRHIVSSDLSIFIMEQSKSTLQRHILFKYLSISNFKMANIPKSGRHCKKITFSSISQAIIHL